MNIPKEHQTIMPYLMLEKAAKFSDFAKTVFNAVIIKWKLRKDGKTPMHCELTIGGSTIMFTEATEQWKPQTANLFVYVASADETYKKAIASGAETVMALSDQDYGRTCGVCDPFGNIWWITSINS
jgi:PhnB protein